MLEKQLPEASKNLWKLRGTYDQIVLIDWMTNEQNFKTSKLAILKEILTEVLMRNILSFLSFFKFF